jgi:hypothetical protein
MKCLRVRATGGRRATARGRDSGRSRAQDCRGPAVPIKVGRERIVPGGSTQPAPVTSSRVDGSISGTPVRGCRSRTGSGRQPGMVVRRDESQTNRVSDGWAGDRAMEAACRLSRSMATSAHSCSRQPDRQQDIARTKRPSGTSRARPIRMARAWAAADRCRGRRSASRRAVSTSAGRSAIRPPQPPATAPASRPSSGRVRHPGRTRALDRECGVESQPGGGAGDGVADWFSTKVREA